MFTIISLRIPIIVNYSDRLVKLLREVRQLGSLGFIIPSKIIGCASVAEKFYKYAIVLKQLSQFNLVDEIGYY
uniref:Dynein heavy chain tail domain-containing protein n=1 Tax=Parascaris equorum TaxID=6256 RepID=A0A914SAG4_PAREQ